MKGHYILLTKNSTKFNILTTRNQKTRPCQKQASTTQPTNDQTPINKKRRIRLPNKKGAELPHFNLINTNPLDEIIKTTSSKGIHKSMGGLAAAISKTERQTHRTPALKLSHFKTAFLI